MKIEQYPKFNGLAISSKFAICGLPIRLDSYRTCSFGCKYCFSNGRKIMEFNKERVAICNVDAIRKRLERVQNGCLDTQNFLDMLISKGLTWHCGGMSDPFQPIEEELRVTHDLIDITSKKGIKILFSTKSNTVYSANITPTLHSFQLSVSNISDRKDIEPNVPTIDSRLDFFRELKSNGFRVGIRIQPFIPNVTTLDIMHMFKDADHFTIEGIKLVPQNDKQKKEVITVLQNAGVNAKNIFTQKGLLNIKPEVRYKLYQPFIDYFEQQNISYSIADNDMRWIGNNQCCCGDKLVWGGDTKFNITALISKYGKNWTYEQVMHELSNAGVTSCQCNNLFTSNRTQGCKTVGDFYNKRFTQNSSPFSPLFQYNHQPELF